MEKKVLKATETVKEVAEKQTKTGKTFHIVRTESGNEYTTFNRPTNLEENATYEISYTVNGDYKNFESANLVSKVAFAPANNNGAKLSNEDLYKIMSACIETVFSKVLALEKLSDENIPYALQNAPSMVNTLFMTITDRRR